MPYRKLTDKTARQRTRRATDAGKAAMRRYRLNAKARSPRAIAAARLLADAVASGAIDRAVRALARSAAEIDR